METLNIKAIEELKILIPKYIKSGILVNKARVEYKGEGNFFNTEEGKRLSKPEEVYAEKINNIIELDHCGYSYSLDIRGITKVLESLGVVFKW